MSKANMSMCLIVKNEPNLEKCILSFRDYVEELVIVDTGSTDGITQEVAKKYADIFEVYTDCNDPITGNIDDFSMARNRSFDLATKNWAAWCDADDIIIGAENFVNLIAATNPNTDAISFMFPYEYAYNELGQCTCLHYRERLFSNQNKFVFTNPVHEVKIPLPDVKVSFITDDSVVYKHQRQYSPKQVESGRNLRILKKYFEKVGESDARQMYYLGLEYLNNGFVEEAIKYLTRYVDISGWSDERTMACLKLVDIYQSLGQYENGLKWAFKCIEICENWGEGYFALGRMFYFIASQGGPNEARNWERCVYFSKLGLNLPPTKTLLFVNPLDRDYEIHRYLNMALNKTGDVVGALESVNTALKSQPNDQSLITNKRIYEVWLAKKELENPINALIMANEISKEDADIIGKVITKQPLPTNLLTTTNIASNDYDLNSPPNSISNERLQMEVISIWKQFILNNETAAAVLFLENAPSAVRNSDDVKKALEITKNLQNKANEPKEYVPIVKNDKALDIVFYCGPALELWNPNVAKDGLGGSEQMACELSKRLAKLGHRVRVYNDCRHTEGMYDGVEYISYEKYYNLTCNVLVISRRTDMVDDQFNVRAKLKLLWVHDIFALSATNKLLLKFDRILALSKSHRDFLIEHHNIHPNSVIQTRNGIDLSRFNKKVVRDQYKCINASSPDRHLPILLTVWPQIKKRVPRANLTIAYGFKNWENSTNDPLQQELIQRLKQQLSDMKSLDVKFIDRVSQERLAEEYLSSGVLLYPTFFTESSYIGGAECLAAGTRFVGSAIGAINDTVGDRGCLIPGIWTDISYQNQFIEAAVKALLYEDNSDRQLLQEYAQNNFCLDKLAQEWEQMMYNLIEELKYNPINSYFPTKTYR